MHIAQALTSNGIAAVLLCSLMISFRRKFKGSDADIKIFFIMLAVNLFQCIVEPITIILDGKQFAGNIVLTTVLNSSLFIGNILFATLWALYAGFRMRMYKHKKKNKLRDFVAFLPAGLIILGALINLFTPVFFRITDQNVYERTDLFFITYIVTYTYLLIGTVIAYGFAQRMDRYVFLPAAIFLAPVVIASIIQYLLPPGYSFLWAGAAVGMASAYVTLLDENSSIDPLTGTLTRHYFNQHLKNLRGQSKGNHTVAGIMLDIDNFKLINDSFGHTVGDEALRNVGKLLRRTMMENGMVFRFGGDEYAIIMQVEDENTVIQTIDRIHQAAAEFNLTKKRPYQISLSVGYTLYISGEPPIDFIKRMDDAMYTQKHEKRQA